jgi:hypothetical protein
MFFKLFDFDNHTVNRSYEFTVFKSSSTSFSFWNMILEKKDEKREREKTFDSRAKTRLD